MAKELTFDTTNAVTGEFVPQTSFMVFIVGSVANTDAFTIEMLPTQEASGDHTAGNWLQVPNSSMIGNLAGTADSKVATANGSPGFKYRVRRTAGSGAVASLKFYWDHITSLRSVYN